MVQIHKMDNGGLDRKAPGYMIREETDKEMMRGRVGKRIWRLERKLEEGREEKWRGNV